MPKAAFRGDEELTDMLKISYGNARADGLTKEEAHAYSFGRMMAFKNNGRVPADPPMNFRSVDKL